MDPRYSVEHRSPAKIPVGTDDDWKMLRISERNQATTQNEFHLYVHKYNSCTLATGNTIHKLHEELKIIHWKVIGWNKINRKGEQQIF